MKARVTIATLLVAASAAVSCKDDIDFVHVIVRNDPVLDVSTLELGVTVEGSGQQSAFAYTVSPKRGPGDGLSDFSDFTVSFGAGAGSSVDILLRTRPSGEQVDWGGDSRVTLPGGGRVVSIGLSRGEFAPVESVRILDGDMNSLAPYGGQVVLGWPAVSGEVALLSLNPERPQGLERPPKFGVAATKVRVASRPSSDFTSELFAASWIEQSAIPTLKTETRTQRFDPHRIGTLTTVSDVHIACARRALLPSIVSAAFSDGSVTVHAHDEAGATTAGPFTNPQLSRVNRIVGLEVTLSDTATLAVNDSRSRLVQISTSTGATLHEATLNGTAVAMSLDADGERLLVATVTGIGDDAVLQIETFSSNGVVPTGEPSLVGKFPFVPGVPASRVSIASCAIAWPQQRADGSGAIDVRFQQLDNNGRPSGEAHFANVGRDELHFAPTVACLSPSLAFMTFLQARTLTSPLGRLLMRRLPLTERTIR